MFVESNLKEFIINYSSLYPEFTLLILDILDSFRHTSNDNKYYDQISVILSKIDLYPVFTYGTLMRGERAHNLVNDKAFIMNTIVEEYDFYDLGSYPAVKKGEKSVIGELYVVDDETLKVIDRYEGKGVLYNRDYCSISYNGISVRAFIYTYINDINVEPSHSSIAYWRNKEYVWYVCYGSNLLLDRFMCYLTGDALPKYGVKYNAARRFKDTSKPIASKIISIPYKLYFGSNSIIWDNGGTAFLDKDTKSETVGRAYLITKEQYNHVKQYEGSKYQHEIELEPIDGIRALTFTNENKLSHNNPGDKYANVIRDGLLECGLSEDSAFIYLKNHWDK